MLRTISRLYRNYQPLSYFALLAAVLAAFSVGFFIPVLMEFWETGLVRRFPTLIVCGFVMIAAVQSLFAGLILNNMAARDRREFEFQMNVVDQFRKLSQK